MKTVYDSMTSAELERILTEDVETAELDGETLLAAIEAAARKSGTRCDTEKLWERFESEHLSTETAESALRGAQERTAANTEQPVTRRHRWKHAALTAIAAVLLVALVSTIIFAVRPEAWQALSSALGGNRAPGVSEPDEIDAAPVGAIPSLEDARAMPEHRLRKRLEGVRRDDLVAAWGEPGGSLSGLFDDVWGAGEDEIIVYYNHYGDPLVSRVLKPNDIPPLEQAISMSADELEDLLLEKTHYQITYAWGDSDGSLSGMFGEIWTGGDESIVVYFSVSTVSSQPPQVVAVKKVDSAAAERSDTLEMARTAVTFDGRPLQMQSVTVVYEDGTATSKMYDYGAPEIFCVDRFEDFEPVFEIEPTDFSIDFSELGGGVRHYSVLATFEINRQNVEAEYCAQVEIEALSYEEYFAETRPFEWADDSQLNYRFDPETGLGDYAGEGAPCLYQRGSDIVYYDKSGTHRVVYTIRDRLNCCRSDGYALWISDGTEVYRIFLPDGAVDFVFDIGYDSSQNGALSFECELCGGEEHAADFSDYGTRGEFRVLTNKSIAFYPLLTEWYIPEGGTREDALRSILMSWYHATGIGGDPCYYDSDTGKMVGTERALALYDLPSDRCSTDYDAYYESAGCVYD